MNKLLAINFSNSSQNQIDNFVLESISVLVIIIVFILSFYYRKKVYKYFTEIETYNNLPNIRLYLGLTITIIVAVLFVFIFFIKILH